MAEKDHTFSKMTITPSKTDKTRAITRSAPWKEGEFEHSFSKLTITHSKDDKTRATTLRTQSLRSKEGEREVVTEEEPDYSDDETEPEDDSDSREDESSDSPSPFYVHIDVLYGSSPKLSRAINTYMLQKYYFDPRRYFNFFDEVFAPKKPTLAEMRCAMGKSSPHYYELWRVKGNFSLDSFYRHFRVYPKMLNAGDSFKLRLCEIKNNEHSLTCCEYQR